MNVTAIHTCPKRTLSLIIFSAGIREYVENGIVVMAYDK